MVNNISFMLKFILHLYYKRLPSNAFPPQLVSDDSELHEAMEV